MKRISAWLLLTAVAFGLSVPALARTHNKYPPNKYQGVDRASRKAQKREQKAMDRYAQRQRKAERKLLKTQNKKSTYKPSHPWKTNPQ